MPDPGQLAILIPILIFSTPIVAILTSHQRKMAELYHNRQQLQSNPEIAALRQEVMELKQLIHQQAIAMDSFTSHPAKSSIQERIGQGVS